MAIRDARIGRYGIVSDRLLRKANQEWELAGMCRRDGDTSGEKQHTDQAREYEQLALESRQ